jgi:hypothetical protein
LRSIHRQIGFDATACLAASLRAETFSAEGPPTKGGFVKIFDKILLMVALRLSSLKPSYIFSDGRRLAVFGALNEINKIPEIVSTREKNAITFIDPESDSRYTSMSVIA